MGKFSIKRMRAWFSNFLFRKSELHLYIPLLREGITDKRKRILDDRADLINQRHTARYQNILRNQQLEILTDLQSHSQDLLQECIDPCAPSLFFWYLCVLAAIVYYFFETTIALAYGEAAQSSLMSSNVVVSMDWLFIAVLCVDTLLQLQLGYIRMGVVVTNRFKVIDRYLHYYIFFDIGVIAVLMLAVGTGHYSLNYFKLIIVIKVVRVLEINWLVQRMLVTKKLTKVLYVIVRQIGSTLLFAHCIGVMFYAIDSSQVDTPACQGKNYELCWLHSATAYEPISSLPWHWQYFYSLYWGINIVCNIGYGDIGPINPKETIFACICFALCLLFAGYIVKQIVGALGVYIEAKEKYRDEIMSYTKYMNLLRLDIDSQQEIKAFLIERYMKQQQCFEGKQMIEKLPQELKKEYYQSAYKYFLNGLTNFYGKQNSLVTLLYSIKQKVHASGELICRQGEVVDSLSFLHSGSIDLYTVYGQSQRKITEINCPASFYLTFEFFLQKKSLYTIKTTSKSVCYFINREVLSSHYQTDEQLRQSFHFLAHELINQRCFARIFYNCFFCYANHHWYQCYSRLFCLNLSEVECKRQVGQRLSKITHRTLKDRSNLDALRNSRKRAEWDQLRMLQRRLFKLVKKSKVRVEMDVDRLREWSSYLQHDNFSKIRAKWNNKFKR